MKGALTGYPSVLPMPAKSKAVATLLAFSLGGFGAPDFYPGYEKVSAIKLVVWVVDMILYIPSHAPYVQSLMTGDLSTSPGFTTIPGSFLLMTVGAWVLVTLIQMLIKKSRYVTDVNGQSPAWSDQPQKEAAILAMAAPFIRAGI